MEGLQRLVLEFKSDGIQARVLYRSEATSGAGPGTKARRREVADLTRTGLERALRALKGPVESIGTSGFTTREDTLLAPVPSDTRRRKPVNGRP